MAGIQELQSKLTQCNCLAVRLERVMMFSLSGEAFKHCTRLTSAETR